MKFLELKMIISKLKFYWIEFNEDLILRRKRLMTWRYYNGNYVSQSIEKNINKATVSCGDGSATHHVCTWSPEEKGRKEKYLER